MPDNNENQTNPTESPQTEPNNEENLLSKLITRAEQKYDSINHIAPFGIEDGKYVQLKDGETSFTLDDFYKNFKDFKENGHFIQWQDDNPEAFQDVSSNIKVWYNTEWTND